MQADLPTNPGGLPDGPLRAAHDEITVERIRWLHHHAPSCLALVVAGIAVACWLLFGRVDPAVLFGWAGALSMVTVACGAVVTAYGRNSGRWSPESWERVFTLGALANGLGWGLGSALFLPAEPATTGVFLFIVAALIAGTTAAGATSPGVTIGFSAAASLPAGSSLITEGSTEFFALGSALLIFAVAMSATAIRNHRLWDEALIQRRNCTAFDLDHLHPTTTLSSPTGPTSATRPLETAPLVVDPPPALEAPDDAPPSRSRLNILIVDDDDLVARALKRMLLGHEVTIETKPYAALELLDQIRFDVVFCDLTMPGLSGIELYQRLADRSAALAARVVLMTGGVLTTEAEAFLRQLDGRWLSKPFEPDQLDATLHRVVTATRAGSEPPAVRASKAGVRG